MPIDDSDIKETLIAISTSILPPIVTLTETSAGTVYDRTIHPPPWPYTNPTPTTRSSGSPPPLLSSTSFAASSTSSSTTSTCTSSCSISYGCSVTATSTLGTYTLAPFGYWTVDSFDRASDLDAAYASSVYADVISELADWFPETETVTVTPVSTTTISDVTARE
ncbi:uncharacterized protein EAE98_001650 [Botrytis deweyae]|uniref:Uncharacterized protein n=1 Tax=Botrytis deweyae TaxID=2478750 RepID=A0ABQ7IYK4_9HELO|nr:uncharacterized protein EAE98_001650 [Botrytis deweyae]KAF7937336.1 hypothetical protein EAE98_001650 [Botrytis deweyae]